MDSFSADVNVDVMSHQSAPFCTTSFSVNSCLFMHSEVSCRFRGKNDIVVLQFPAEKNKVRI